MKSVQLIASTGFLVLAVGLSASGPAQARHMCIYSAWDHSGHRVKANASHRRGSVACKRAKRRCERKLKRAQRKRKIGRTHGCRQMVEAR